MEETAKKNITIAFKISVLGPRKPKLGCGVEVKTFEVKWFSQESINEVKYMLRHVDKGTTSGNDEKINMVISVL